jgi:hypothetical protein
MPDKWINRSWKDVVKENVDAAVSFFFPEIAALRDSSIEPEIAEPKHISIFSKSDKRSGVSDLYLSIPLKKGGPSRTIIVIEQRHSKDPTLPERMFECFYRASVNSDFPVTCLAIYTGDAEPIDAYEWKRDEASLDFKFNAYSVANAQENLLKIDEQAFATPLLTAKLMLKANGDAERRAEHSLEILDRIKRKNLDPKQTLSFQKFAYRQFQIDLDDISKKVKEAWNTEIRLVSEVVKKIYLSEEQKVSKSVN